MIRLFKKRSKRSIIWKLPHDQFKTLVKSSNSFSEILKHFELSNKGGNCATLKRRLQEEQIDYSHIKLGQDSNAGRKFPRNWMTEEEAEKELLITNSLRTRAVLRRYLKKYNLIPYQCKCGLTNDWQGKPLTLQLEHKNGVSNDHRLTNLEWLCPNCHSQTKTFAGRSKKY